MFLLLFIIIFFILDISVLYVLPQFLVAEKQPDLQMTT